MAGLEGTRLCGGSKKRLTGSGEERNRENSNHGGTFVRALGLGYFQYFGVLPRRHFGALRGHYFGVLSKHYFGALSTVEYSGLSPDTVRGICLGTISVPSTGMMSVVCPNVL